MMAFTELDRAHHVISHHYEGRVTERNGISLMNHIDEGVKILKHLEATEAAIAAFCLHPLVQEDSDLLANGETLIRHFSSPVVFLTMEYRNCANAYLSFHNDRPMPAIVLEEVRLMLIADKIQNRKDFLALNMKVSNAERLKVYFELWIDHLDIRPMLTELTELITEGAI